jgi:putative thiamine transport system ATP-binding protein
MSLVLKDVKLSIGGRPLLGPLSLEVRSGETVTVMGASGSGKSSLLAYICGTLDAAVHGEGDVTLGDENLIALPVERRRVGILFQDDVLFPHMTVGGNLAFGLPASARGRTARVAEALREAELDGFADRDPATLSGGQRARVALMRVLLAEPRALLLDEPFGRLDAALRKHVRAFVLEHARRRQIPMLLVTHDPEDAAAAGGNVIELG